MYVLIKTTLNTSFECYEYENTLRVNANPSAETNIIGVYKNRVDVESKLTEIGLSNFYITDIFNGHKQVIHEGCNENHYQLEVLNTEELTNGISAL